MFLYYLFSKFVAVGFYFVLSVLFSPLGFQANETATDGLREAMPTIAIIACPLIHHRYYLFHCTFFIFALIILVASCRHFSRPISAAWLWLTTKIDCDVMKSGKNLLRMDKQDLPFRLSWPNFHWSGATGIGFASIAACRRKLLQQTIGAIVIT